MPVINTPRRRRLALPVAIVAALLTAAPGTAQADRPGELQATRAALLTAVDTCSTRVPAGDPDAVGRCARDLAIPDPTRQNHAADLLATLFFCLRVEGAYPTISDCMYVHGH